MLQRLRRRASAAEREALARSEQRFRSLVDNAHEIVLVVDPDSRVQYATPRAAERLLGWDTSELIGRPLTERLTPGERPRLLGALASSAAGDEGLPTEWTVEHRDGQLVELEAVANNLLDDPMVCGLVLTLRDVTQRKTLERQLRHQAFHDALTGIANRALFEDRVQHSLDRARRGSAAPTVLFVDIDDFKTINDSLGHAAGDRLLVEIGNRLSETLRDDDTAARLGGDEFAILLEDRCGEDPSADLIERLTAAVAVPILIGGEAVTARFSIGVAQATATTLAASDLLRDADTGYSSPSYLRELAIDSVKIDRSFIDGLDERPRDNALVSSIVELARTLDLRIVAEGVERHSQLDRLRTTRCDYAQGYLFARPADFSETLRRVASLLNEAGGVVTVERATGRVRA
ncbi:MAG: hypothetical protein NVS2B6_20890 [Thermoleophilaceae bacterium]